MLSVQSLVELGQSCFLAGDSAGCTASMMDQVKISHLRRKGCQYSG